MPRDVVMNHKGVENTHQLPLWRKSKSASNYEQWQLKMYENKLLGSVDLQVLWMEDQQTGTASLYRDDQFMLMLNLGEDPHFRSVDEMRDKALEAALDYITVMSVYLQNYIALALKTNPGVEE